MLFSLIQMKDKEMTDEEFIKKYEASENQTTEDFIRKHSATQKELEEIISYLIQHREMMKDVEINLPEIVMSEKAEDNAFKFASRYDDGAIV